MRSNKPPIVTYGVASHKVHGGLKLNTKGLATTAGATSLALVAYLTLYNQAGVETASGPQPSERRIEGNTKIALAPNRESQRKGETQPPPPLSPGALQDPHAGSSIVPPIHRVSASDSAGMTRPLVRNPAITGPAFEIGLSSPVGLTMPGGQPRQSGTAPAVANILRPPESEPGLLADQGMRLAADSNALARDLDSNSRLNADAPQIAHRMPLEQVDAARPDGDPTEISPPGAGSSGTELAEAIKEGAPSLPVPVDTSPEVLSRGSIASVPPPAPSTGSRAGNSPLGIRAMTSRAGDLNARDVTRRHLAGISRRLEDRLKKQERNPPSPPSRQAELKGEPPRTDQGIPVVDGTGERIGENTTFQISDGELVSVQLSELISLFESRLDRPLYVWLKTSANADKFVTPETLARAGIHMSYDRASGQAILTIAE